MGYNFTIKGGVRPKKAGRYSWPLKAHRPLGRHEEGFDADPGRTIQLDETDVLTRSPDGTYMVHTGLGCFGIVMQDDEVEPIDGDAHLTML